MIVSCGETHWALEGVPLAPEERLRACHKLGFRSMETAFGAGPFQLDPAIKRGALQRLLLIATQTGVTSLYARLERNLTSPAPEVFDAALSGTVDDIHLAKRLGARCVILGPGRATAARLTTRIWERLIDALWTCERLCREQGMTALLETRGVITWVAGVAYHEPSVATDRGCLRRLLDELPETFGFAYDPGDLVAAAPGDTRWGLDLLSGRIGAARLRDWCRAEMGWLPCSLGEGEVPYFRILRQVDYSGAYLLDDPNPLPAGLERALAYLKRIAPPVTFE